MNGGGGLGKRDLEGGGQFKTLRSSEKRTVKFFACIVRRDRFMGKNVH